METEITGYVVTLENGIEVNKNLELIEDGQFFVEDPNENQTIFQVINGSKECTYAVLERNGNGWTAPFKLLSSN